MESRTFLLARWWLQHDIKQWAWWQSYVYTLARREIDRPSPLHDCSRSNQVLFHGNAHPVLLYHQSCPSLSPTTHRINLTVNEREKKWLVVCACSFLLTKYKSLMYQLIAFCFLILWFCIVYINHVKKHAPKVYAYDSARAHSPRTKWDRVWRQTSTWFWFVASK